MSTALQYLTIVCLFIFSLLLVYQYFLISRTSKHTFDARNFDTLQNIYLSGIHSKTPEQCLQIMIELISERFNFQFSHVLKFNNKKRMSSFHVWHHTSLRICTEIRELMEEAIEINYLTSEVHSLPLVEENLTQNRIHFIEANKYQSVVYIPLSVDKEVRYYLECFSVDKIDLKNPYIKDFFKRLQALVAPLLESVTNKQELINAKQVAQNASRIKTEFLAMMSHEIRTPLQGLLGMTKMIKDRRNTPETSKYATMAYESATSLYNVITNVLDYSKIESGRLEILQKPFDVIEIISSAIDNFSTLAQNKNLALNCHFSPKIIRELNGDKQRIWEVVVNLVSNAIKFTEKGSIDVFVETTDLENQQVALEVRVKDTGIGIPLSIQNQIFNSFVQGDHGLSRKQEGSGLGLSICKSLIELMQGEMDFFSHEEKGSTFWFRVNLKKCEFFSSHATQHSLILGTDTLPNASVLLVEDNEVSRYYFEYLLKQLKISLVSCATGEEAIEALNKNKFDVILLDCHLPKMSGFDVARYIRMNVDTRQKIVPIIAITGISSREDKAICESIGVNDFIFKPILEDEFLKKISRWVAQSLVSNQISFELSNVDEPQPSRFEILNQQGLDFTLLNKVCEQHVPEEREFIMREVIEAFFKNTPNRVKELNDAIECKQFETIWRRSHSIRTSAEIFGAKKLALVCRVIEEQGRQEKLPSLQDKIELTSEFTKLEATLKQLISNPNPSLN